MNQVSRIRLGSSSEREGVDIQAPVSEEVKGKGGAALPGRHVAWMIDKAVGKEVYGKVERKSKSGLTF